MADALIGLDIGYQHVRAVKIRRRGKGYRLLASETVSRFDEAGQRKPLEVSIAELDSRMPLKGTLTVASSDLAAMVRFEHNDPMPADRLERVLRLELSQHSGMGSDDMAADAIKVPIDGESVIHCCGLAQPGQVLGLLEDLGQQKVEASQVQLAPAGLANILRSIPAVDSETEGAADGYDLLIDVGSHYTRVVLARETDFIACRQLQIGGDFFTEQLAKDQGLRFDEAEARKLDAVVEAGVLHEASSRSKAEDESSDHLRPSAIALDIDDDSSGRDIVRGGPETTGISRDAETVQAPSPTALRAATAEDGQRPENEGLQLDEESGAVLQLADPATEAPIAGHDSSTPGTTEQCGDEGVWQPADALADQSAAVEADQTGAGEQPSAATAVPPDDDPFAAVTTTDAGLDASTLGDDPLQLSLGDDPFLEQTSDVPVSAEPADELDEGSAAEPVTADDEGLIRLEGGAEEDDDAWDLLEQGADPEPSNHAETSAPSTAVVSDPAFLEIDSSVDSGLDLIEPGATADTDSPTTGLVLSEPDERTLPASDSAVDDASGRADSATPTADPVADPAAAAPSGSPLAPAPESLQLIDPGGPDIPNDALPLDTPDDSSSLWNDALPLDTPDASSSLWNDALPRSGGSGGPTTEVQRSTIDRDADTVPIPLAANPHTGPVPVLTPEEENRATAGAGRVPWKRGMRDPEPENEPSSPGKRTAVYGRTTLGPQFQRAAEDLYVQVSKTVSWFQGQLKQRRLPLRRVWLVGGGSDLHGLTGYLERRFGKPVATLDPFAAIGADEAPAPRHHYAQALGLALAGAKGAVAFDLRPESLQHRLLMKQVIFWPRLTAVLVVAAVAALVYGMIVHQQAMAARESAYAARNAEQRKFESTMRSLRREEAGLQRDLRAIAGRIFAGRDLLSTIRALKMHAPEDLWLVELRTEGIGTDQIELENGDLARGYLYLTGVVKGQNYTKWDQEIAQWDRSLADYRTQQRNLPLFEDRSEVIEERREDDPLSDAKIWRFTRRFPFRPTKSDEWTTFAARGR